MSQHQDTTQPDKTRQFHAETPSFQEKTSDYEQALQQLASRVRGELVLPGSSTYEAKRHVWSGAFDKHPAAIVQCLDAEDVQAVVTFAREQALTLSVRSGGHSMAGHSTNDNGLVIDLSAMKGVQVDPQQRTARLEPGLTSGELAKALEPYSLALTTGDTASVGLGGVLLGGGIGWMVRAYGLAIDQVRSVELVTADGHLVRASAEENPELFWGLRGGGGNFGVVTAFEVNLHPGGQILGGIIFYEAPKGEAERILQEYVRLAAAAPEGLSSEAMLILAPPVPFIPLEKQGTPVVAIVVCYTGDLSDGEQAVAPLRQIAPPLADLIASMPYSSIFAFVDVGEIRGLQHHLQSQFFQTLSQEMVHALVEATQDVLSPETLVQLRVIGGAMSRVPADATAFAHRDKQGILIVNHFGPLTFDSATLAASTKHIVQAVTPYAEGSYVNFLGDEGEQRIREAYTPATYERLVALKNQYDPTNVFHLSQTITPTV